MNILTQLETLAGRSLRGLLLLGCSFVAAFVPFASASAQSLDSLVREVQGLHPSVISARLTAAKAQARSRAASAWDPPSVGLQFSMLPPGNPNPFARGETMLMFEQAFPLFGAKDPMVRAMVIGEEVGASELEALKRELRTRVAREYFTLWFAEQRWRLNDRNHLIATTLYKTAEAHYVVDQTAQSDIYRSTIELERLVSERRMIEEDRLDALARLNALLGRVGVSPVVVDTLLGLPEIPSLDSLSMAIASHPRLQAMSAMARMSDAESEAELAMLKPMLMLRAGISYMPDGHPLREGSDVLATLGEHSTTGAAPMHIERIALSAGAMLSVPIAPWSRVGPEERALDRQLEAEQKRLDRDAMEREMTGMLRTAYGSARRAAVQLAFIHATETPLLLQSLQLSQREYMDGKRSFSTVLENYLMLVMSSMNAAMQRMEYAMAVTMIEELTGASL